ncbi:MAG: porin [Candidatus Eisenbacteria bacterium]
MKVSKTTLTGLTALIVWACSMPAEVVLAAGPSNSVPNTTLSFESEDSSFAWRFDARLYLDAAFYAENKNELSNGIELRRGRFAIKARLWETWNAEFDIDFAGNETDVEDAWISWMTGSTSVKVGNFKEPFGLERLTSSRRIPFMERSLPSALTPGRQMGLAISRHGSRWFAAAGMFGQDIGDDHTAEDQGYAVTGRIAVAPINKQGRVFHLGAAATRRTPDAEDTGQSHVRLRTRPETHVYRSRFLDTGSIPDVEYTRAIGLEQAASIGRLSVQSEYLQLDVVRTGGAPDVSFQGAYAHLSWLITGKPRPYLAQEAEFGDIEPEGWAGACEFAVRYSWLDLNDWDAGITGGEAENVTIGVNWYPNANVRLMCNFVIVNNDAYADGRGRLQGDDDFEFFQTRFQVCF